MRVIALLLLFAVLPTVELVEQVEHAIAHVLHAESPDHDAHHGEEHGDEHGCTGLVHLCSCHHAQVTSAVSIAHARCIENLASLPPAAPTSLTDLTSREPAQRPPIG